MDYNKVLLCGRLTRDPELRYTPSGVAVTEVGLAINRYFNDKSGQRQEETCFIEVVLWQKQAELCHKYLKKGRSVFIEGRLSLDSWQNQEGQKRSRLKVTAEKMQFVDKAPESGGYQNQSNPGAYQNNPGTYSEPVPAEGPPDVTMPQSQDEGQEGEGSHPDIPF